MRPLLKSSAARFAALRFAAALLVATADKGGGALVTPLGETVLAHYRTLEAALATAARGPAAALMALLQTPD